MYVGAAVVTVAAAMEGAAVMAVEGDEEQGEGGEEKNCTSKDISFKGSLTEKSSNILARNAAGPKNGSPSPSSFFSSSSSTSLPTLLLLLLLLLLPLVVLLVLLLVLLFLLMVGMP